MATQKQTEKKDDDGKQVALTRQDETQQIAQAVPTARQIGRASPVSSIRRLLDELDVGMFGWRPSSIMRRMLDDMERLFDDFFEEVGPRGREEWMPRMEVRRGEDQLVIRVDLPGVPNDQVSLSAQDDMLVIEGERVREGQERELWQSERSYGRFRRIIALPEGVDLDQVNARFDNGVLEISIPVPRSQVARRIPIGTGEPGEPAPAQAAPPEQQPEQPAARPEAR